MKKKTLKWIELYNKPKTEEIKYLGKMFAQNAWGNDDAKKIIDWYAVQLEREMEKNMVLEIENFKLSCKPKSFLHRFLTFNH